MGSEQSEGWRATKIGLQLAGSRIDFKRRDPSRIYNAVFASSNRSGLIGCLLFNILLFGWKYSGKCYFETDEHPKFGH